MPDLPLPNPNPLEEVDAASLDALMAKNPMEITQGDLGRIIQAIREQRARWGEAEAAGKKAAPKKAKAAKETLSLDEL